MASTVPCKDVAAFLVAAGARSISTPLSDPDLEYLQQLGLVRLLTAAERDQLAGEVARLEAARSALSAEAGARAQEAGAVQRDQARTHSIFFHFEGAAKQQAADQQLLDDQGRLTAIDADLLAKQQAVDQLVSEQSLLDTVTPCGSRFVAVTGSGIRETRDLQTRLYRVADTPFAAYWQERGQTQTDLDQIAGQAAAFVTGLAPVLAGIERSYLWAVAVGLAKLGGTDATASATRLVDAYRLLDRFPGNRENRLLSAGVLAAVPRPVADLAQPLAQLDAEVQRLRVPKESALSVAALLLLGQRADGSFATPNLARYLQFTRSFDAAALLAIVNRPLEEMSPAFAQWRSVFAGWGFEDSEDLELAAAFLTVSALPLEGTPTKLAILTRGLAPYLEYPLVAGSILASIPVLEANETLNLLSTAYEIVGRRAMPMAQGELLCLAVRMVHGVRSETVGSLDATAPPTTPVGFRYPGGGGFLFVPVWVVHTGYYSTFSGIGGVHPAHVHAVGGMG